MLPGIVGALQANEAIKLVVGYGRPLIGRLLILDAQATTFNEVRVRKDPACATCGGEKATIGASEDRATAAL